MRIVVFSPHTPFPAVGGGRADVWRRILGFVRLGHSVMLVHQHEPSGLRAPSREHFAQMDATLSARFSYPIVRSPARTIRQLAGMRGLPWHVAKAVPTEAEHVGLQSAVRQFRPELVWLEGPWQAESAMFIAREAGVPIAYRSHNIEHLYIKRQALASASIRNRVAWQLATVGLKQYEQSTMQMAGRVFDISLDDMAFWSELGVHGSKWLPPLPELALEKPPTERVGADVLFVGGLRLPNNIDGVGWLVGEVLPVLRAQRPDIQLSIVGSAPTDLLKEQLDRTPGIKTHFDVPSVTPHLCGASVLVNPVSVGSGVQLKMLDMLMTDAPIVTRSQGARGLPFEVQEQFTITDDAAGFAAAVLRELDAPSVDLVGRSQARELFTLKALSKALASVVT